MKTKKIISIITVTFLAFNMFGCASDEKINNEKDDYTSSSETTKKSTDKPAETTTIAKSTEEPTTEIKEYGSISITKGDWAKEYDFLFDYQDIVIKHFDGKEFHNGTTTDVRAEVINAGYDLAEHGKTFAAIYSYIVSTDFSFDIIEKTYADTSIPVVDENTNFIFKNVNEESFKILITFEGDNIIIRFQSV
ncbi:MAG: hypothetical protein IJA34_07340 [Lachnospiraceae bacterium]|nr:hypothetical protein [Lachnospiraceae bacterium]